MDRLTAPLFAALVLAPLKAARTVVGAPFWPFAERASAGLGAVAGRLLGSLVRASGPNAGLERVLRFTEILEGALGIRGRNEIVDATLARRTIEVCPFAERLRDMPEFCTSVGGCAGVTAFAAMVPGAEFRLVATKSRGAPECIYEYRVPPRA